MIWNKSIQEAHQNWTALEHEKYYSDSCDHIQTIPLGRHTRTINSLQQKMDLHKLIAFFAAHNRQLFPGVYTWYTLHSIKIYASVECKMRLLIWFRSVWYHTLNDDTKILTETDTETFFKTKFSEAKTEIFFREKFFRNRNQDFFSETKFFETETDSFFRNQIFRNWNRDFFSDTKFSETDTETFFRDQIFSIPKPRLFFWNQIFQNRNRNPQRFGKSFETEKFWNRNVNLCSWDIRSER